LFGVILPPGLLLLLLSGNTLVGLLPGFTELPGFGLFGVIRPGTLLLLSGDTLEGLLPGKLLFPELPGLLGVILPPLLLLSPLTGLPLLLTDCTGLVRSTSDPLCKAVLSGL
jgi:hypothetical protein